MEKEKLMQLARDLNSDSKSASEKAKKSLIKAATPIIKRWFNTVRKYDDRGSISTFDDYLPSRGGLDDVWYREELGELEFKYTDSCLGDFIEDYITLKLDDLADEGFFKRVEAECWKKAVKYTKEEIAVHKRKLENLEKKLADLESNKPEK